MKEKSLGNKADKIEILQSVVANAFVVYMKTYAVHWNYHGPKFFSIHKLTEGQYEEQADAIDEIAERIRALGGEAPISLAAIIENTSIKEFSSVRQNQDNLVRELVASNQKLAEQYAEAAHKLEELEDGFSHDMLTQRIGAHEKAAWMLHSQIE